MSLVQGIRNSLSNNRGKIGLAAGVGSTIAAQNYIKENPALVNQAEYNIMAKGNNLLSPVTGKQEISQDIQDNVNGYYNHLQENPKNILGIDRPVLQGEDAYNLSQGIQTFTNNVKDFPKSVQDVFENQTLIVPIKDMILEGCGGNPNFHVNPEDKKLEEVIHTNRDRSLRGKYDNYHFQEA